MAGGRTAPTPSIVFTETDQLWISGGSEDAHVDEAVWDCSASWTTYTDGVQARQWVVSVTYSDATAPEHLISETWSNNSEANASLDTNSMVLTSLQDGSATMSCVTTWGTVQGIITADMVTDGSSTIYGTITPDALSASDHMLILHNTNDATAATLLNEYTNARPALTSANVLGVGGTADDLTAFATWETSVFDTVSAYVTDNSLYIRHILFVGNTMPVEFTDSSLLGGDRTDNPIHYLSLNLYDDSNFPALDGLWSIINPAATISNHSVFRFPNSVLISCLNGANATAISAYIDMIELQDSGAITVAGGSTNDVYILDWSTTGDWGGASGKAADISNDVITARASANIYIGGAYPGVDGSLLKTGTNVAGYFGLGHYNGVWNTHSPNASVVFNDGTVTWGGTTWALMTTHESFNGRRYVNSHCTYDEWFSTAGVMPVAGASHVHEPGNSIRSEAWMYWDAGNTASRCIWFTAFANVAGNTRYPFAVMHTGDPFATKDQTQ